jgi:ureidoacrylate peracid hydrolase
MGEKKLVLLQAEPKPLEIDLRRTAVMIIDMQNAFVKEGAFLDSIGAVDLSSIDEIIENNKRLASKARLKGVDVIYTIEEHLSGYPELGDHNSDSVGWYKNPGAVAWRERPELRDKMLIHDTWGADIIDELKPQEGEIINLKHVYSAFFETNLNSILKAHNLKYLLFTGTCTSTCVEASLRDAYYYGYFPILVSDATVPPCPCSTARHEGTIVTVKVLYGWVATTDDVLRAME